MRRKDRKKDGEIKCPNCQGEVLYFADFSLEHRQHVAQLLTVRGGAIETIKYLRESFNIGIGEAKEIFLHVSRKSNFCHLCDNAIEGFTVICNHCHSLNFNWTK